jgi:hypothetical protein
MLQIFIIYCLSVTTMSHQGKSVARMSQNFHHTLYISDYNVSPMEICGTNVADFHHILYISDYNVKPMEICSMNVTEFSSYIVYWQLQCLTNANLWHKCHWFSSYIVYQ